MERWSALGGSALVALGLVLGGAAWAQGEKSKPGAKPRAKAAATAPAKASGGAKAKPAAKSKAKPSAKAKAQQPAKPPVARAVRPQVREPAAPSQSPAAAAAFARQKELHWKQPPPSRFYPHGIPELRPEFLHPLRPVQPAQAPEPPTAHVPHGHPELLP